MDAKFRALVAALDQKYRELLGMPPVTYAALPRIVPDRGIYLFSERGKPLYVGRTNRIRSRLGGHCRPSASHFTATFAFRLAREATGRVKPTYKTTGSRADLLKNRVFASAFRKAKARVAAMDIKFVEERDPVRQALLEIYVATVLGTPHNDFDNH